uniref:Uncharacterized protein n=1 Tax=Candidatus Kentrum sp. SD TaxID=2126332 RepID=A0A450YQX7_9GAMM|nr:MAG: hypothetical protein BECKSD772F_GA0070984_103210 [Candidatus Kentron sp. SD]VFK43925.1 MAG: hypothetical protein BECKSD772E_GA0070983_103110 [Candidatus Kentron sp. SD]
MAIMAGVHWDRGIEEAARKVGFPTGAIRDEMELTASQGFEARRC